MSEDPQEKDPCPICWTETNNLVHGPCNHTFCRPCIEQYLLAPPEPQATEESIVIPTQGFCPICREILSLFEMLHEDETPLYPPTEDSPIRETPLMGSVYVECTPHPMHARQVGYGSLHFPEDELPFYNSDGLHRPRAAFEILRFHEPSRTLRMNSAKGLEVTASFSSDWRFITRGVIRSGTRRARIGGASGRGYERLNNEPRAPPTYHAASVWGNVFCQALRVGMASYHFEEEGQVYISYEHPVTSYWPPLDNGNPIPSRVYFQDVSFPDPHTFRGEIRWQDDHGTTWQGMKRWVYEIQFDEEYVCIVGGHVRSEPAHDTQLQVMSTYGRELVYVNAALWDQFEDTQEIDRTLGRVSSSPSKVQAMVRQVLRSPRDSGNPIDYNV